MIALKQPLCNLSLVTVFSLTLLLSGCATQQGYQGASLGALTGSAAGALIDDSNPWRGAAIGGSLGAAFGGALTDRPYYRSPAPHRQGHYYQHHNNRVGNSAALGGVTGATAGILIDRKNRWRGGLIGGVLGSLFGGGIGNIHSQPYVPVLNP